MIQDNNDIVPKWWSFDCIYDSENIKKIILKFFTLHRGASVGLISKKKLKALIILSIYLNKSSSQLRKTDPRN